MQVNERNIEELNPATYNPRSITDAELHGLMESIKKFGFVEPVVFNKRTNTLVGGHQRVKAALALGKTTVPVYEVDLSLPEEKALNVALNSHTIQGKFEGEILSGLLEEIKLDLPELSDAFNFDQLAKDLKIDFSPNLIDESKEDDVPEVKHDPITRKGDVWILGEHRLMCGDSTVITDVDKLMDGQKADMVFTDPPYGMNLDTDYSKMPGTNTSYKKVNNDDKKFDASFIFETFSSKSIYLWGADYYFDTIPNYFDGNLIVWAKRQSAEETKVFGSAFELCWTYPKQKKTIWFERAINQSSERLGEHPTQKPVVLTEKAIEKHSPKLVVDIFGGSGSTLIACEKTNRKCYMMELDEHYCDVIINRWQNLTGKTAVHDNGTYYNALKEKVNA